jgi:hypothetical protein
MERKISQINELLCNKSHAKQVAYQLTLDSFNELKEVMKELQEEIMPCLIEDAPNITIKYFETGTFEAQLKFAGDTLVAMMHTNKEGESKLLPKCELPLTGKNCIRKVVSDLGYFEIHDGAFHLKELAPGVSIEEVKAKTAGKLVVDADVKEMVI